MTDRPTIVRVWRGRTRRDVADAYERYNYEEGIRPLIAKAMGVQTLREDREDETAFVTISYWADEQSMASFTGADPRDIHHLPRDPEFLIELPDSVQVLKLRHVHGRTGERTEPR
jgi:heme-degrading monooxygenase HmoA